MDQAIDPRDDLSQWGEDEHAAPEMAELPAIIELLRRRSGVDFSLYKVPTLSRRISQRMARGEASSPQAYLQRLGDGHRVIHGVAGSGKTMILGYRAEYLARAGGPGSKPIHRRSRTRCRCCRW